MNKLKDTENVSPMLSSSYSNHSEDHDHHAATISPYKDHDEDFNSLVSDIRVCNLSLSSLESSPTSADSHSNGSGLTRYSDRNLIINYIPSSLTDSDLLFLFNKIGPVKNCRIIRDKHSQQSFGFGFCEFEVAEDAKKAIEEFNGYNLAGKILKVAFARLPGQESKNCNLFVQNLPLSVDQEELQKVFAQFGRIVQCRLIMDNQGHSRRIGFVLYENRTCAAAARNALNDCVWPGDSNANSICPDVSSVKETFHNVVDVPTKGEPHPSSGATDTAAAVVVDNGNKKKEGNGGVVVVDNKKLERVDHLVKVQFAAENSKKCRTALSGGAGSCGGPTMLSELSPSQLLGSHHSAGSAAAAAAAHGMVPQSLANWCGTPPAIPVLPLSGVVNHHQSGLNPLAAALLNAQQQSGGNNVVVTQAQQSMGPYWLNHVPLSFAVAAGNPAALLAAATLSPNVNHPNSATVSLAQSCNVPISAAAAAAAYRNSLPSHFFNGQGIRSSAGAFFAPTQHFTGGGGAGAVNNVNGSNNNGLNNPFLLATPGNHPHHHPHAAAAAAAAAGFSLGLLNSAHPSPNGPMPFAHLQTGGNPVDLSSAAVYFTGGAAASGGGGGGVAAMNNGAGNYQRNSAASARHPHHHQGNNNYNSVSLQQLSPPTEPPYVVYIYNIGNSMSEEKLKELFKPYGSPKKIDVPRESGTLSPDPNAVRSKNFGFVTFDDVESALKAIRGLNGSTLEGRQLQASFRKEKTSQPRAIVGGVPVGGGGGNSSRNNVLIHRTASSRNVNMGVASTASAM